MKLHLIELENTPILEQLKLEEALLRTSTENYCIFNYGSSDAIVMGSSGKPEHLLNFTVLRNRQTPVIKRFSGGGTVYIDPDTLFVSFIFQSKDLSMPAYPQTILHWTGSLYREALNLEGFTLRENDYALGEKKIGGNAQYIRKTRWLHHTTFLWDYQASNMECLLMPPKVPDYRKNRPHEDFLTRIKDHLEKAEFFSQIRSHLAREFDLTSAKAPKAFTSHVKTTELITV